jgi:hypothetical protein
MSSLRTLPLLVLLAAGSAASAQHFALDSLDGLELHGVVGEPVTYQGRAALRVLEQKGERAGDAVVILTGSDFGNGSIEVDLAARPAAGAVAQARGFAGIAFRVAGDASRLECFYLRPTNGRADDQLRRNHSTQYVSHPDYPWYRLREETPGQYESYVDLVPGEWTKVRIEVEGTAARLFVNGAEQPVLIVNDLKLGEVRGAVALWIGLGTEAFFSNLVISPER